MNFRPYTPSGWGSPLSVSNSKEHRGTSASIDAPIYISWAAANYGSTSITSPRLVEIYWDGILVRRWTAVEELQVDFFSSIDSWFGLSERIRLEPGNHVVLLVLDPLDSIPESNESDNTYKIIVTLTGTPPAIPDGRTPDLAFVARDGWDSALLASTQPNATQSASLSVDVLTQLRYGIANLGPVTIGDWYRIHWYWDDQLLRDSGWHGALAGQEWSSSYSGLSDQIVITPGEHTIRMVIDPGNVIAESDESNNEIEATFTWGTGEPAIPEPPVLATPTAPEPLGKPNLKPYWRYGWGGPIMLSNYLHGYTLDPVVASEAGPYIRIAVTNESLLGVGAYNVDLLFDDVNVKTFEFVSLPGGYIQSTRSVSDLLDGVNPTVGTHTLRLVIDPDNEVDETNEDDNVYELEVEWLASPPLAATPKTYTTAELAALFDGLVGPLDDSKPLLGSDSSQFDPQLAIDIAYAGYFLATGESIQDSLVNINIVDDQTYKDTVEELFRDDFATRPLHLYPSILARREEFKNDVIGYTTAHRGEISIVVNAERPFADVVTVLAHELGHARAWLKNPDQADVPDSHSLRGLGEAQAELFERVVWQAIQEHLEIDLFGYPSYPAYTDLIARQLDNYRVGAASSQHDLGRLLVWSVLFTDLDVAHLKTVLLANGALNASQNLELYDHLVAKRVDFIDLYVDARTLEFDSLLPQIATIAFARLQTEGFDPSTEGPPALRSPTLLMP